jgi:RimJ/RimL family protein N-acetyltransferase
MSSRVSLREVIDADVEIFYEHQRDPVSVEMAAFPARDKQPHEQHWAKIRNDANVVTRTITFGDEVSGNIGCWVQDDKRLIGFWIGREFWGKGIATDALAQFVNLLRERPLYAYVAKNNVGSIRVLEKCGFRVQSEDEAEDGVVEYLMKLPEQPISRRTLRGGSS